MTDRIIIMGNEEELIRLAEVLDKEYCGRAANVVAYNDEEIETKTESDRLFLVGHADALAIGDYGFEDLKKNFSTHIKNAKSVYLAGCSTADKAAQIIKEKGFVPLNIAQNVKKYLRSGKPTYGTPGVLYLMSGDSLKVARSSMEYTEETIFIEV